jgi:hypothetical protein
LISDAEADESDSIKDFRVTPEKERSPPKIMTDAKTLISP